MKNERNSRLYFLRHTAPGGNAGKVDMRKPSPASALEVRLAFLPGELLFLLIELSFYLIELAFLLIELSVLASCLTRMVYKLTRRAKIDTRSIILLTRLTEIVTRSVFSAAGRGIGRACPPAHGAFVWFCPLPGACVVWIRTRYHSLLHDSIGYLSANENQMTINPVKPIAYAT